MSDSNRLNLGYVSHPSTSLQMIRIMQRLSFLLALFIGSTLLCYNNLLGQSQDLPPEAESQILDAIEFLSENSDYDVDYEEFYDMYKILLLEPLDLNKANFETLYDFRLLTLGQIQALMEYRLTVGELINIYEIQSVPEFDLATIYRILPFVRVSGELDDFQATPKELLFGGKYYWFTRFQRVLEDQAGYIPKIQSDGSLAPNYLGSPWRIYSRFRYTNGNKVSYGITGEKDAGEEFFKGSQKNGFDFYSAHFFMRDIGPFKNIALGDFTANFGQGLILWTGLGFGKSADAVNIKRNAVALKPYTSVNEYAFLRGAAVTLEKKKWETTLFASYRNMDATITAVDSLGEPIDPSDLEPSDEEGSENIDVDQYQTSLPMDGYHRTNTEVSKKQKLSALITGANLKYSSRNFAMGINGVYHKFGLPLARAQYAYNQYQFDSDQLFNLSVDYRYLYRNMHFFGETGMSNNGGLGTLNGMMMAIHPTVEMSILHRYYQKDFQTFFGLPFGEATKPQNEEGLYIGTVITPIKKWKLAAYMDMFRFNWLRFTADAPSRGGDQLVQLTYKPNRNIEIYARYRNKNKEQNLSASTDVIDQVIERQQQNFRIQVQSKINKELILRNRVEFVRFNEANRPRENGYILYQDIQYKPLGKPYSISGRVALFDTDSYNSRIYAFENDVLYSFSIPAFQGRGIRYFIMTRFKIMRWGDLSLRLARTEFRDAKQVFIGDQSFSSIYTGNALIKKSHITEFKIQWMFKW